MFHAQPFRPWRGDRPAGTDASDTFLPPLSPRSASEESYQAVDHKKEYR